MKSPIPKTGLVLASLGAVLEVEFGGVVWRWPRGRCEMLWHPESKALMWFDADEEAIEVNERVKTKKAEMVFERFKDRDPERLRAAEYPIGGQWRSFGKAQRIDYHSDKWDGPQSYTHDLGPGVVLYRQGPTKGPWLFVLRGGRLRVTRRGLVD